MVKGIIHAHTKDFSYDGQASFKEIKNFCKKNGYEFVAVTEHSKSMSRKKMKSLIEKCKKMSDENLIFIPGLEIETKENYEILGIGLKKYLHNMSIEDTVRFIRKNKGLAILAHPSKYKKLPENPEIFDGIEILNFEYDGFFPCLGSLKLLKKARKKNKKTFGYFGLDLHRKIHFRNIFLELECKVNEKEIIQSLKYGKFRNKTTLINLGSTGKVSPILKFLSVLQHLIFIFLKKIGLIIFKILRKIKIYSIRD